MPQSVTLPSPSLNESPIALKRLSAVLNYVRRTKMVKFIELLNSKETQIKNVYQTISYSMM